MSDTLRRLVDSYMEGEVSPDQAAALAERIRSSPADARLAAEWMLMSSDIAEQLGVETTHLRPALRPVERPAQPRRRPMIALAAAMLLAACGFAIVTLVLNNHQSPIDNPQSPAPLASVTDVIDGTLMIDDQLATAGNDYAGRSISLDAGEAEFMLPKRVTARLRGKTQLKLHDAMNVALASGTAEFDCPPGAKGYTVHLPGGAKVVDLGTRFVVATETRDHVRVELVEGHAEVYGRGDTHPTVLETGEPRWVDRQGTVVVLRTIELEHAGFESPTTETFINGGLEGWTWRTIDNVNGPWRPVVDGEDTKADGSLAAGLQSSRTIAGPNASQGSQWAFINALSGRGCEISRRLGGTQRGDVHVVSLTIGRRSEHPLPDEIEIALYAGTPEAGYRRVATAAMPASLAPGSTERVRMFWANDAEEPGERPELHLRIAGRHVRGPFQQLLIDDVRVRSATPPGRSQRTDTDASRP